MKLIDKALQQAIRTLNLGGVVVHATEGVFGFACSVASKAAYEKISSLKGRDPQAQPYLVLVGDATDVNKLVSTSVEMWAEILLSWPGPNTWVFPDKTDSYPWLGGADGSLAIRMPGHSQALELLKATGPLISTSANRTGQPACLNLAEAQREFGPEVDFYLPGELVNPGRPSRITHAESGELLRA